MKQIEATVYFNELIASIKSYNVLMLGKVCLDANVGQKKPHCSKGN